jgi:GH15 family glucan-1,4-alpha-glucosidase
MSATMNAYPPIAEHGLIGDLHTAALVTTDGCVDWLCLPRFDSPSVFASLLDKERGGHFRIAPAEPGYVTKQLYLPDSAVLITRFMSPGGVGELIDFMPVVEDSQQPTDRHRLMRIARVVRGEMSFVFECMPRFDYGRAEHTLDLSPDGAVFRSGSEQLTLHAARLIEFSGQQVRVPHPQGDGLRITGTVKAGQVGAVMLESGRGVEPHRLERLEALRMLDDTVLFWRRWLARSTYTGRWREQVLRSAMTLKLMTYAPSGALVAAPTAGLPEQVGGERNWDYRFTWVRDASFSVAALLGLGYVDEASAFVRWLSDRVQQQVGSDSGPLKIMYRVDGSSDLIEETLDHLEGYGGSRPVRIGNGASDQLQLDIYGEAMEAIHIADRHGVSIGHESWTRLARIHDWLCDHWDEPDEGIWETRGGRQDFVYGRLNCWTAFDRAIRLATERGRPADLAKWRAARDAIYEQVMEKGFDEKRGAFVQHYGSQVLDASLLRMVHVNFVAPNDPMWQSTLDAMGEELVSDSLVYRYNPGASPDGLRGSEGTFSLCTFWYVEALARSGRLEQARLAFEKMLTYANHLGLYAEEIGLTGEQLGNFPQAFTHLALINAALKLNAALDQAGLHGVGSAAVRELYR